MLRGALCWGSADAVCGEEERGRGVGEGYVELRVSGAGGCSVPPHRSLLPLSARGEDPRVSSALELNSLLQMPLLPMLLVGSACRRGMCEVACWNQGSDMWFEDRGPAGVSGVTHFRPIKKAPIGHVCFLNAGREVSAPVDAATHKS